MAALPAGSRGLGALRTGIIAAAVSLAMFGFGYAMIPLYYRICAALGIDVASSGTLSATAEPPPPRAMRVEFDANSHNELVAMRPAKRVTELRTGTAYTMTYEIRNLTDMPVRGTAIPAYAPAASVQWFNKLQCFCFNELELAPNEVVRAPVVFLLERDMPAEIGEVALSYTFHLSADQGGHGGHGE